MRPILRLMFAAMFFSLTQASVGVSADRSTKMLVCKISLKQRLDVLLQKKPLWNVHKGQQELIDAGKCFKVLEHRFYHQLKEPHLSYREEHFMWYFEHLVTVVTGGTVCGRFRTCYVIRHRLVRRSDLRMLYGLHFAGHF